MPVPHSKRPKPRPPVCVACGGCGRATNNTTCHPCNGTGRQGAYHDRPGDKK